MYEINISSIKNENEYKNILDQITVKKPDKIKLIGDFDNKNGFVDQDNILMLLEQVYSFKDIQIERTLSKNQYFVSRLREIKARNQLINIVGYVVKDNIPDNTYYIVQEVLQKLEMRLFDTKLARYIPDLNNLNDNTKYEYYIPIMGDLYFSNLLNYYNSNFSKELRFTNFDFNYNINESQLNLLTKYINENENKIFFHELSLNINPDLIKTDAFNKLLESIKNTDIKGLSLNINTDNKSKAEEALNVLDSRINNIDFPIWIKDPLNLCDTELSAKRNEFYKRVIKNIRKRNKEEHQKQKPNKREGLLPYEIEELDNKAEILKKRNPLKEQLIKRIGNNHLHVQVEIEHTEEE